MRAREPNIRRNKSNQLIQINPISIRSTAMKTIVSALIALSVLAGIAGPVAAADAKSFYEQADRAHY